MPAYLEVFFKCNYHPPVNAWTRAKHKGGMQKKLNRRRKRPENQLCRFVKDAGLACALQNLLCQQVFGGFGSKTLPKEPNRSRSGSAEFLRVPVCLLQVFCIPKLAEEGSKWLLGDTKKETGFSDDVVRSLCGKPRLLCGKSSVLCGIVCAEKGGYCAEMSRHCAETWLACGIVRKGALTVRKCCFIVRDYSGHDFP